MCGVAQAGRCWQGAAGSGICRCCGETEEKHSSIGAGFQILTQKVGEIQYVVRSGCLVSL